MNKTIEWIKSQDNSDSQVFTAYKMIEYLLNKNKTFKEALKQLEKNSEKCLIITQKTTF